MTRPADSPPGAAAVAAPSATALRIVALLTGHRYQWRSEYDLQDGVAGVLTRAGFVVAREVVVAPRCRVDLLLDNVGIEVKVRSSPETVLRQLQAYARSPRITELVLATTQARHRQLPAVISQVPLSIAYLTHTA